MSRTNRQTQIHHTCLSQTTIKPEANQQTIKL